MDGYPGRMMEHAILLPNVTLPAFNRLERVDYGENVPMPGEYMPDLNDPIPNTPSSFNHGQFAGWFYLTALQHLEMCLRDTAKLHERPPDLTNLRTLILARSTILEEDVPFLLDRASFLQNLHLGLVYSYYDESVFQKSDCIAQALESVSSTVERLSISLDYISVVVGHGNLDLGELERYEQVRELLKKFTRLQTAELPMILFVNYTPYPENHTDISAIWPDTLREVGLRDYMTATHENRWNESRIID